MSKNIVVEYKVNKIVNEIAEVERIRRHEVSCYPMCILYGHFPESVKEMLRLELISQMGMEEAVDMLHVINSEDTEVQIADTVNRFRKKMENGELHIRERFFIPVIFMADQLNAQDLQHLLLKLEKQMKKMGYENNYKLWYYCIYDYEQMNGLECKEQIQELLKKTGSKFSISYYTQTNHFVTEYQKYLKCIQSMAMHIFLKISKEDETIMNIENQNKTTNQYVMGYWKQDVLKQKIIDYLIDIIRRQEQELISRYDYFSYIKNIIEEVVGFDENRWINAFLKMPVNYTKVQEYMQSSPFSFRRPMISYGELLERLYGRADVFSCFIRHNLGVGNEEAFIDSFFERNIGNLDAICNCLNPTLDKIKKDYENEKNKLLYSGRRYEDVFRFEKNCGIDEIHQSLAQVFWIKEAKIADLERKEEFVNQLKKRLKSEEFKNQIERIRERNAEEIKCLEVMRREVSMAEGKFLKNVDFSMKENEMLRIPLWKEDIFDDILMEEIRDVLPQMKQKIQGWMHDYAKEVLGDFTRELGRLKMSHKLEEYYSARLIGFSMKEEMEYIYIGRKALREDNELETLQTNIRTSLPWANLYERNWETDMCFELFAIKEVEGLYELYNVE